jgi:ATP synthase protein I
MAAKEPEKHARRGYEYLRTTMDQTLITLVLVAIAYVFTDRVVMLSLLYGALCALLPQAFFALRMQQAARQSAQRAARLGLAAEGGKFLLSAASFALVFAVLKPERPGLVFLGFGVLWLIQLVTSARMLSRPG